MKILYKGQAAILIIFVIGMVGLLIGMSLSKTGFGESIMGRGVAASTYAFYVANSGIEDAFYKIQASEDEEFGNPGPENYTLEVGEGIAKITVRTDGDERVIESTGQYKNFIRKIRVVAYNTTITPDFARIIQAGTGGIEIGNTVNILGRDKFTGIQFPVSIYSNSFVRGTRNGNNSEPNCDSPNANTQIYGNVYAVTEIEKINPGTGPCIDFDAFAGSLKECRIYGKAYSADGIISNVTCPYNELCDPLLDPETCKAPEVIPLPNIGANLIKQYLQTHGEYFDGNCTIGGANDCSTVIDGRNILGNMIIDGDLDTVSNQTFYLKGPVWVTGDARFRSNQTINLDPEISDETSLIILTSGKIITESNVVFTSDGYSFLLLASEHPNNLPNMCNDTEDIAITISANVQSILFYAIKGCALVNPSAGNEFYGAIIAEGVKIENNVDLVYDPTLQDASFFLREGGGWQISSFTEL